MLAVRCHSMGDYLRRLDRERYGLVPMRPSRVRNPMGFDWMYTHVWVRNMHEATRRRFIIALVAVLLQEDGDAGR